MNITLLTIKMMLNLTARWLEDQRFRDILMNAGALGGGILEQLEAVHDILARLASNRSAARKQVRQLIDRCVSLDQLHDRRARAVFQLLSGLIESTDDDDEIATYQQLQGMLFPVGLRIVQLPYIEEGGAAVELERGIGPTERAQMAEIKVGSQTLERVFESWMQAAHELGEAVQRRAAVQASLTRKGSSVPDIDIRHARRQWLQAVRGLLWAIEMRPELRELAEPVEAALAAALETAQRRRKQIEAELDEDDEDHDELEAEDDELVEFEDLGDDQDEDHDEDQDQDELEPIAS